VDDGLPLTSPDGTVIMLGESQVKPVETSSKIRRAIRMTQDLLALGDPDPKLRQSAILKLAMRQQPTAIPILEQRQLVETDAAVKQSLAEAVAIVQLAATDSATKVAALGKLKEMASTPSRALVDAIAKDENASEDVRKAAAATLRAIDNHLFWVDFFGTIFRGVSLGSVLLWRWYLAGTVRIPV
jgi:urea transport system permease protein